MTAPDKDCILSSAAALRIASLVVGWPGVVPTVDDGAGRGEAGLMTAEAVGKVTEEGLMDIGRAGKGHPGAFVTSAG